MATDVSSLSAADLATARRELHEDPRNTPGAVSALREWVEGAGHVSFPTDTKTLMIFLRNAKFSQLRAREVIENFCKLHVEHPKLTKNLHNLDDNAIKILKTGWFYVLPRRGEKGQTIVLHSPGAVDPKLGGLPDYVRVAVMTTLAMLQDEHVQVCGMEWLIDLTGFNLERQRFFTNRYMQVLATYVTKTLPIRQKGLHHYNENKLVSLVVELFQPLLSKKIKSRFHFHGSNMEKVYKHIPKECLPVEFLPDNYDGPNGGTVQQLIDDQIKSLQRPEVQAFLKHISSPDWGIDLAMKKQDDTLPTTFRKLDVN